MKRKYFGYLITLAFFVFFVSSCARKNSETNVSGESETITESSEAQSEKESEAEDETESEKEGETESANSLSKDETALDEDTLLAEETYPETMEAPEAADDESPYFGIMYASVVSVNASGQVEDTSYTLIDKSDTMDSWTLTELEIGDVAVDMTVGTDVVLLFNGDVINDSENVRFLAALPDGSYSIKKVTGVVNESLMSTFELETDDGEIIYFIKDNQKMDEGALNTETEKEITVYYADGGDMGNFPLRIYG